MSAPMSPEREQEIRDRAVYLHDLGADADEYEIELSAGSDVPALLAEMNRLRGALAARPTRAEAYRHVADELRLMQSAEPDTRHAAGLYAAEMKARRMADAAEQEPATQAPATGTEYAVRANGGEVMNILSSRENDDLDNLYRHETEARTKRYADSWPDAEMVQRTAYYGPWTAVERGEGR